MWRVGGKPTVLREVSPQGLRVRYSVTYIYYCVLPRYEELEGVEKLVVAVCKRPGDLLFSLAVVAARREAVYRPSELQSWRCK